MKFILNCSYYISISIDIFLVVTVFITSNVSLAKSWWQHSNLMFDMDLKPYFCLIIQHFPDGSSLSGENLSG